MPERAAAEMSEEVPIAPRWHTAMLVALYVTVAAVGMLLQHQGVSASALPHVAGRATSLYLPMVVVQWCLAFYVCRIGRPRSALRALLGRGWTSAIRAAGDVALAALGWALIKAMEIVWTRVTSSGTPAVVTAMLPHTPAEALAWGVVSVSVGFCEELVFRAYLQAQFRAFTGRAGLAVALQAGLFGLSHGEQGALAMARVAIYGLGLGVLAHTRRSLVPGILCHIWTDLASGLLRA